MHKKLIININKNTNNINHNLFIPNPNKTNKQLIQNIKHNKINITTHAKHHLNTKQLQHPNNQQT